MCNRTDKSYYSQLALLHSVYIRKSVLVAHPTRMRCKLRVTVAYNYSADVDLYINVNITT